MKRHKREPTIFKDIKKAFNPQKKSFDKFYQITLKITDQCNLNCRHCDQRSHNKINKLSDNDLYRIIDNIQQSQLAISVLITGGEPLLHNGYQMLTEKLHAAGLSFDINTSLNYNQDTLIILRNSKPRTIRASLHNIDCTNDTFCNIDNDQSFRNACILSREQPRNAALQINYVITPENSDSVLQRLTTIDREIQPDDICIMPLFPNNKLRKYSPMAWENYMRQLKHILTLCQNKYPLLAKRATALLYQRNRPHIIHRYPCHAGEANIFIDNYGKIYPCLAHQIYKESEDSICLGTLETTNYLSKTDTYKRAACESPHKNNICINYCPLFFRIANKYIHELKHE